MPNKDNQRRMILQSTFAGRVSDTEIMLDGLERFLRMLEADTASEQTRRECAKIFLRELGGLRAMLRTAADVLTE